MLPPMMQVRSGLRSKRHSDSPRSSYARKNEAPPVIVTDLSHGRRLTVTSGGSEVSIRLPSAPLSYAMRIRESWAMKAWRNASTRGLASFSHMWRLPTSSTE